MRKRLFWTLPRPLEGRKITLGDGLPATPGAEEQQCPPVTVPETAPPTPATKPWVAIPMVSIALLWKPFAGDGLISMAIKCNPYQWITNHRAARRTTGSGKRQTRPDIFSLQCRQEVKPPGDEIIPSCGACGAELEPPVRAPHTVYVKSLYRISGQDYCRHDIIKAAVAAVVINSSR